MDDNRLGRLSTPAPALASLLSNTSLYLLYRLTGRGFEYPALGAVIPSAIALNLSSICLLLLFSRHAGWRQNIRGTVLLDLVTSLIPIGLLYCARLPRGAEGYDQPLGLLFVLYVFMKLLLFAWHAGVNIRGAGNRKAALVWVFAVSSLGYSAVTPWVARNAWPAGDEPHYLLLTYSLLVDHDLDLSNNYRQGDYKTFYPPDLPIHHTLRNSRGQEFPIHDIGLSLLLVPGYAVAGRVGAMVELSVLAALLSMGMYALAIGIGATARAALTMWGVFSFTCPVVIFSSQIYPEVVGGAVVVWATLFFGNFLKSGRRRDLALAGLALSLLPWFSVRYWVLVGPMLAVIALYIAVRGGPGGRTTSALVLAAPTVLSIIAFVWVGLRYYNTSLPNAGYFLRVVAMREPLLTMDIHVGLLGLLFDRAYGLLPAAPIYLLPFAGALVMLRRQPWLGAAISSTAAAYMLFSAASRLWYGGWSPPARLICVGAVLLAPLASLVILNRRAAVISGALCVFSVLVGVAYTASPMTRYSLGLTGALSDLVGEQLGLDYGLGFPSMIRAATLDYGLAALWAGLSVIYIGFLVKRVANSGLME